MIAPVTKSNVQLTDRLRSACVDIVARSKFVSLVEEARIKQLHDLIREVIQLQDAAQKLLGELTEQLRISAGLVNDRPERRRTPRD